MGRTASVKSIIPMPPIHWVRHRHMFMPWESDSTDSNTVAPVVVNPDMVSKNASLNVSGVEHMRNGSIPKQENRIHTRAVSRNPSRLAIEE